MEAVMTKYLKPVLILFSGVLFGCVEPALVVGNRGEPIAAEAVAVYYIDRPQCHFETIAHLRVTGGYYSLESMFSNMRKQAAELGANGVYVLYTQQSNIKEYFGTAKAIRCLPA
jgi:hypothetical protein